MFLSHLCNIKPLKTTFLSTRAHAAENHLDRVKYNKMISSELTSCRECRHPISPHAPLCPSCGAPRPAQAHWRGSGFEYKSTTAVWGLPLVHIAFGRDVYGKLRVAKGIIAIGQFGVGLITVAQFGIGLLFGFGQFILGLTVIAQFAAGPLIAVGQFALGYVALGQVAIGCYALGQSGWALHFWGPAGGDPAALAFFNRLWKMLTQFPP